MAEVPPTEAVPRLDRESVNLAFALVTAFGHLKEVGDGDATRLIDEILAGVVDGLDIPEDLRSTAAANLGSLAATLAAVASLAHLAVALTASLMVQSIDSEALAAAGLSGDDTAQRLLSEETARAGLFAHFRRQNG